MCDSLMDYTILVVWAIFCTGKGVYDSCMGCMFTKLEEESRLRGTGCEPLVPKEQVASPSKVDEFGPHWGEAQNLKRRLNEIGGGPFASQPSQYAWFSLPNAHPSTRFCRWEVGAWARSLSLYTHTYTHTHTSTYPHPPTWELLSLTHTDIQTDTHTHLGVALSHTLLWQGSWSTFPGISSERS